MWKKQLRETVTLNDAIDASEQAVRASGAGYSEDVDS